MGAFAIRAIVDREDRGTDRADKDELMNSKVLLVEDEASLVVTLRDRLRKEKYAVTVAKDGESAMELAGREHFDMLILDVMLPGISGLTVCERLRKLGFRTPILMLSARRQLGDRVTGLEMGADDYLTKPFEMPELLVRIEALLRRAGRLQQTFTYSFGDIQIDFRSAVVSRNGQTVNTVAKEFQLLSYLIDHKNAVVSRESVLREIWGYEVMPISRTVDVHIANLRQKIEADPKNPRYILTVAGSGYKFVGD